MNYRRFGKLNWSVSSLGFGTMRLPGAGGDEGNVDEAESIRMLRHAIDSGVNYIDTSYTYLRGKSEVVVGKALKDGYREKVHLATKTATRSTHSREHLDKVFNEQLKKLQLDNVDFYLFGGLGEEEVNNWAKVEKAHFIDWAEEKMAEGRIGHLGFSFHGGYDAFREIIDGYEGWTFCQTIFNYVDAELGTRAPGLRAIKYAKEKGLAIVVMEPIQGGNLATRSLIRADESLLRPGEIQSLLDEAKISRSPADLALQWVWNHPEVSVALSGMGSMKQVVENMASASISPDILSEAEMKVIERIREIVRSRLKQTKQP